MNIGNLCARYHSRSRVFSLRHRLYPTRAAVSNNPRLSYSPSSCQSFLHRRCDEQCIHAFRGFASANNGESDDDDEEWMPPDHSPLVTNINSFEEQSTTVYDTLDLPPNANGTHSSPDEIAESDIEVIDLEATINNQHNQRLLQDDLDTSDIPSSEFDVELNDVGWKEILKDMRDDGKTAMMEGLVNKYNLQSHVAALDDDDDNIDRGTNDANADDEQWDEEFEQSLQGLSQEDLIDELIENSPHLSQLEMEVLSQELERSEQGKGGLDYDSLEESDLNDNEAYKDFRAMVLEDYHEKREARLKKIAVEKGSIEHEQPATTTNFSAGFPADWRDYDSTAAFQPDFSDDDDSWVPPSSEFTPSQSDNVNDKQGVNSQDAPEAATNLDNTIDWLQARRSRLGGDENNGPKPTHLLTPEQAESFRNQNSQIPVIKHTLFTTSELSNSLSAQGGTDIHIINTTDFDSRHGVGIGCNFIMLVTGRNASHIRVLADSAVRNLKARKLDERGVMGAMQGAEGGQDIFSNKRSRNRARRNGASNTSGKLDDDWIVVDCENIHLHIMEATTRRCLNIEGLWDLSNPNSEGSKLRRINLDDEDEVDEYVASNPIPEEYAAKIFFDGGGSKTDGWISGGAGGRVDAVPVFQKKSFSEKWNGKRSKRSINRSRRT